MFKDTLKAVMQEKNVSQAMLSRMTGIGKPSISQYLSGKNEPNKERIALIANALECSIETLIPSGIIEKEERPPIVRKGRNLTLAETGKLLGKSPSFVKQWLQTGQCPFGYCLKGTGGHWDFFIPEERVVGWLNGYI